MLNKIKRTKPLTRVVSIEKSMAMPYADPVGGIKVIKFLIVIFSKTIQKQ